MEHLLPESPHTSHYGTWSPYHEHGLDYAGDSYMTPAHSNHHVNGEQGNYQHLQYGHFHPQSYVIPPNEVVQHHTPINSPDPSMSYWPAGQVPATVTAATSGPPLPSLPLDPMYYPNSCYEDQNMSPTDHRHATTEDHFQPGLANACAGTATYGTAGLMYSDPDTTLATSSRATALTALVQSPVIAHNQSESGHDPVPVDATARTAMYEGNATFHSTDPSYTQIGPYVDPFTNTATTRRQQRQQHYAPPLAPEGQQQPYVAASAPARDAQSQFIAPAPTPARSKPKTASSTPTLPPRARSPMGHLPYPEEVAAAKAKAESQRRPSSVPSAQSCSPASTPLPLTPVQQTLTFITYPETEPRTHRDGRGGSGADSDDHWDDDDGSSPSRRGRRGKKQPKKDPFLACFFCRGRKIACHPKNEGGEDRTCTQCAKRDLHCQYPLTSRRGQRKPSETAADVDGALGSSPPCNGNTTAAAGTLRDTSKARARASSKLSTSSLFSDA